MEPAAAPVVRGLTSAEARRLLEEHGPNALPEAPPAPLWRRFLAQLQSALIYVLILALVVDLGAWLIEGAHGGKGLGLEFLRHVERTSVLLFLLDASNPDPEEDYRTLAGELEAYGRELLAKPSLVCLNKTDLAGTERPLLINGSEPMRISALTGAGLDTLKYGLAGLLAERC